MSRHLPRISDDEAERLWQGAAELQNEAERSAGSRSNALPIDETHLSLDHVAQAAEGAGIRAFFVHLAIAEQQLPDAEDIKREDWRRDSPTSNPFLVFQLLYPGPLRQ